MAKRRLKIVKWNGFIFLFRTNTKNQTIWHVNPTNQGPLSAPVQPSHQGFFDSDSGVSKATAIMAKDKAEATAMQSHNLMSTAAVRVWEELYITKKPAIEEVSKPTFFLSEVGRKLCCSLGRHTLIRVRTPNHYDEATYISAFQLV